MPSPEHEQVIAMLAARPSVENPTVEESRAGFEGLAAMFPLPGDVRATPVEAGGVPAEWVEVPESRAERVLLYLHGGGYVIGSLNTHRELVARLARACSARALNVDYRLAPEHPFPAAVDDAVAAYRDLLRQGVAPDRIVVAGDSAGGGLTLATLLALRDGGEPLPAAGVCLSPWADLACEGASAQPGGADDPLLTRDGLRDMARHYAAERLRAPQASPVHADYTGLPPLLIQVGTRELLLDDARRVAERARSAGVEVELRIEQGLIHVWPLFGPALPEARQAVAEIAAFVDKRLG